jgi:hypothetical protein
MERRIRIKKHPLRRMRTAIWTMMAWMAMMAGGLHHAYAQQLPQLPSCPSDFLGGPVCDALDQLHILNDPAILNDLSNLSSDLFSNAEQEIRKRVEAAAEDVRMGPAINFFNESVQMAHPVINATEEFLNHPVCGSEAALNELEGFFHELGETAVAVGNLAVQMGEAAALLQPTMGSSLNIATQMGNIANKPVVPGSDAALKRQQLEQATADLAEALAYIAEKEGFKAVYTGLEAAEKVVPFTLACIGCTISIATGSKGTGQAASGATAVTTTCPQTAVAYGGSCWTSAIIPQGLLEALVGVAGSLPTCGEVKKKIPSIPLMVLKSYKFAEASWNLGVALSGTYEKWNSAGIALAEFAAAWEEDSQQEFQIIQDEMNAIGQALNDAINGLEPIINESVQIAMNTLEQTGDRVGDLIDCYNLMNEMVAAVSIEMLETVEERIPLAANNLTQGSNQFETLLNQVDVALQASAAAAQAESQGIVSDIENITASLVGNPPYSAQSTINHFNDNLQNSDWLPGIMQGLISLQMRKTLLPVTLMNAGLSSLNSLDNLSSAADQNFINARNESIAAIQVLNSPPSPPMASLDLIDNPGFPFATPQLAAGNITAVGWNELNISFIPANVNLATQTLRDHITEVQAVRYREVYGFRDPARGTGPCLDCARDFELAPVKDSIMKAPPSGGVTIVIVNTRGAEVVNLGSYRSIDSIPSMQRVEAPRGGFSNDSFGCNLEIEIRDSRGQSLARSPVCVDSM